jgi:calcium permeable stress-gated cation channel
MLFWSTLGLALFHLAYRYNVLFVTDTAVDTRGLHYPRALMQLFIGIYIAEVAMVGMFAISKAAGPAALMAVFLIFTLLFHLTLSKSLGPLLYSLPRSLQVQEELYQSGGETVPGMDLEAETSETRATNGEKLKGVLPGRGGPATGKKGNFIAKFLKPWIYSDYATLRQMMPVDDIAHGNSGYTEEVEAGAYYPPSVTSTVPVLWIPEDPAGVSKQEVALTSKVIPITDEGCSLNEKNKIVWDTESARPPIWTEKVYY